MTANEHNELLAEQKRASDAAVAIRETVLSLKNAALLPAFETFRSVAGLSEDFDFAAITTDQVRAVFPDLPDAAADNYQAILIAGWRVKIAIDETLGNVDEIR